MLCFISFQTDRSRWLDYYQQDRPGWWGGTEPCQRHRQVNILYFMLLLHICFRCCYKPANSWCQVSTFFFFHLRSINGLVKILESQRSRQASNFFSPFLKKHLIILCDEVLFFFLRPSPLSLFSGWNPRAAPPQIFISKMKQFRRDIAHENPPTLTHV